MDRRARPGKRRVRARLAATVVLFARTSQLGRGKRRLARDIGNIGAWRFYRGALIRSIHVVTANPAWSAVAALDPPTSTHRPGFPFTSRPGLKLARKPQARGDLGHRMVVGLGLAQPGPAILIGADIQGLKPKMLARALRATLSSDIVFGPAVDGGFWLIGAKRRLPRALFDGVGWSQPTTLGDATSHLPKAWRVAIVDTLQDVDTADDLSPDFPCRSLPAGKMWLGSALSTRMLGLTIAEGPIRLIGER